MFQPLNVAACPRGVVLSIEHFCILECERVLQGAAADAIPDAQRVVVKVDYVLRSASGNSIRRIVGCKPGFDVIPGGDSVVSGGVVDH